MSIAASFKAQKLAATAQGNIAVLRESQGSFITSARYVQLLTIESCVVFTQQVWPESIQLQSSNGCL